MYQTYWNTSDHVSISALPQSQNIVVPSDQLQSLVAHNARSYSCYRRFVMLRRNWKWSPVSPQLFSVSSESWNQDEAQLFCQSNVVVKSGIVMFRFCAVIGGFVEIFLTRSSYCQSCYRGEIRNQTITAKRSSRSGPLLNVYTSTKEDWKSVPELPLPAM